MAKTNTTDFQSLTKKGEHRIGNTDLYIFQVATGAPESGFDRKLQYNIDKMYSDYQKSDEQDFFAKHGIDPSTFALSELEDLAKLKYDQFEQMHQTNLDLLTKYYPSENLNNVTDSTMTYAYRKFINDMYDILDEYYKYAITTTNNRNNRYARTYGWVVYKKPENTDYKTFVDMIENYQLSPIGNYVFSPINNTFEPDEYGNLILRTSGAGLDNVYAQGGDVLINSKGEVLNDSKFRLFIRPATEYGVYPTDVYINSVNHNTNKLETAEIKKTFLDTNGSAINREPFEYSDEEILIPIERLLRTKNGDKDFVSNQVHPRGYLYSHKDTVEYYPSIFALLAENRKRTTQGQTPLIEEDEYLKEMFERLALSTRLTTSLGVSFDAGKVASGMYQKVMKILDCESRNIEQFVKFATAEEKEQIENIVSENESLSIYSDGR